jgi:hypothetical protein
VGIPFEGEMLELVVVVRLPGANFKGTAPTPSTIVVAKISVVRKCISYLIVKDVK